MKDVTEREGNEKCHGCDSKLTIENIGGYRMYCQKCVNIIPDFPEDGKGYTVKGKYPNLKWV